MLVGVFLGHIFLNRGWDSQNLKKRRQPTHISASFGAWTPTIIPKSNYFRNWR